MDQIEKDIRKRWAPVLNRYKKFKMPLPAGYKEMLDREIKDTMASAGEIKQAIKNAEKINSKINKGGE